MDALATSSGNFMTMAAVMKRPDDSGYVMDAMREYNFRHGTQHSQFSDFSTLGQSWVLRRAAELKTREVQ
jgi:hypothetical protein